MKKTKKFDKIMRCIVTNNLNRRCYDSSNVSRYLFVLVTCLNLTAILAGTIPRGTT